MNKLAVPSLSAAGGILISAIVVSLVVSASAQNAVGSKGISRYTDPKLTVKSLESAENNVMFEGNGVTASAEEIKNLASLVTLEAGGESEEEIRAVTETVLNRVKSDSFPNTLNGVIFQYSDGYYQYSPVLSIGETEAPEDVTEIVVSVFNDGNTICDSDVYYFRADCYHDWSGAVDEFAINNTYFSSSIWAK